MCQKIQAGAPKFRAVELLYPEQEMAPKFELPFTQPSHVVAIGCALLLAIFLSTSGYGAWDNTGVWRTVPRMCHVLAFSMLLGMQFWVSFVAGQYTDIIIW